MPLPYEVIAPDGAPVLQAAECCRYPKQTELDLMNNGYTIRLHGRRITKKELRG